MQGHGSGVEGLGLGPGCCGKPLRHFKQQRDVWFVVWEDCSGGCMEGGTGGGRSKKPDRRRRKSRQ